MRIGYATWNLAAGSLSESIAKAVECGCTAVSFHTTPRTNQKQGEEAGLIRLLEKHDLHVTCHAWLGTDSESDPLARLQDEVDTIIDWHAATGRVKTVSYDPPVIGERGSPERRFDLHGAIERLKYVTDRLARRGIKTAIENWLVNTAIEDFEAVRDGVDHPNLGILLDVGHLNIAINTKLVTLSAEEFVRRLPMPINEIHLHHNDGVKDLHQPLEAHGIVLEQAAKALAERGFDAIATIEHGGELNDTTLRAIAKSNTIFTKLFNKYSKAHE